MLTVKWPMVWTVFIQSSGGNFRTEQMHSREAHRMGDWFWYVLEEDRFNPAQSTTQMTEQPQWGPLSSWVLFSTNSHFPEFRECGTWTRWWCNTGSHVHRPGPRPPSPLLLLPLGAPPSCGALGAKVPWRREHQLHDLPCCSETHNSLALKGDRGLVDWEWFNNLVWP